MKKTTQNKIIKAADNVDKPHFIEERGNMFSNSRDNIVLHNRLVKNLKKIFEKRDSHYISHNGMGLLELVKIKEILYYKDLRSVSEWCRKNNVFILRQGNTQYVNQWEFILSFYKPFIKHLKRKHKNWKELFSNYLKGDLGQLLVTPIESESIIKSANYKAKTRLETSFLDKIKKI